ncbi:transglutaminase-like domain-containing protein [Isosphaeraceae bacterium EP7]
MTIRDATRTAALALLAALVPAPAAVAAGPKYAIESKPSRRVEATLTLAISAPQLKADEWDVFVPKIPALPCQSAVSSAARPEGREVAEGSPRHQPVLEVIVAATTGELAKALTVEARYTATLIARRLVELKPGDAPAKVAPLTANERVLSLRASAEHFDFETPEFRAWLADRGLARGEGEPDVDYARRVFLAIKKEFSYHYTNKLDRHATAVCKAGKSDCGGLSVVFTSAMRAHGIPARLLVGRWAFDGGEGGGPAGNQEHVKAEFYADGVGWVPVDCSSAILHDKEPEGLTYFGTDAGDFIVHHLDLDLEIPSHRFGKQTMMVLQIPPWWVRGSGQLAGVTSVVSWKVADLHE